MAVKNLSEAMRSSPEFQRTFEKKLRDCNTEAARASEAGQDRIAIVRLAQAQVWDELMKAATP